VIYDMTKNRFHPTLQLILFAILIPTGIFLTFRSTPRALAQELTPTAPAGAIYITVITDEPQINVRMGPNSTIYPIVGTLLTGSTVPALGRSQGGDWIQIEYPGAPNNAGWVYSPLVQVSGGTLGIVPPPPTPIPPATSTIDPTLAAQFNIQPTSTRLPTFTPPPALVVPVYMDSQAGEPQSPISLAVVMIALAVLGSIGFLLSLFLRR
jgi:hypothetical protein